jgi:hypothetical protein
MARLDRLGPAARRIAQIGAALGRVFSYDVLLAVATPLQSEHRLREALERLVTAQLVSQIGAAPDALYSFKHVLVQDAAYANLLRGKRQELHGHMAAILETLSVRLRREKAVLEHSVRAPEVCRHATRRNAIGGIDRRGRVRQRVSRAAGTQCATQGHGAKQSRAREQRAARPQPAKVNVRLRPELEIISS